MEQSIAAEVPVADESSSSDDSSTSTATATDVSSSGPAKAEFPPLSSSLSATATGKTKTTSSPKIRIKLKLPSAVKRELSSKPALADKGTAASKKPLNFRKTLKLPMTGNKPEEPEAKLNKRSASATAPPSKPPAKRRTQNPVRPVRLPPLASPGLLTNPTSGIVKRDGKPFVPPSVIFNHHMRAAGYTEQARTERPHRGSSIERTVGDLFDTSSLDRKFKRLVPQELVPKHSDAHDQQETAGGLDEPNEQQLKRNLPRVLMQALKSRMSSHGDDAKLSSAARKRKRVLRIHDILPVSLVTDYPRDYIDRRLKFVKAVQEREKAIVNSQDTEERMESGTAADGDKAQPVPVVLPPIPSPPAPPTLADLTGGQDLDDFDDHHPYYPPKNSEYLVNHLDPEGFHVIEGRYFGLASNQTADPNYCGASAPGLSGTSSSGGAGLATSTAGSGGPVTGSAMCLSTGYHRAAAGPSATAIVKSKKDIMDQSSSAPKPSAGTPTAKKSKKPTLEPRTAPDSGDEGPTVTSGPKPTATLSDLRKIIEEGGDIHDVQVMRDCIVRAAVYASRSGEHGRSFVGSNGQVYPSASKAFALYTGIKPCSRCKNNKQGTYHCRLRRGHKDADHDGGNSQHMLEPLFKEELVSLLIAETTKDGNNAV